MKQFGSALFGLIALSALGLGGCAASTDGAPSDDGAASGSNAQASTFDFSTCGWADTLPPGSYQNSCKECTFSHGTLTCQCLNLAEVYYAATFTLNGCPEDDIQNCDGHVGIGTCFQIWGDGSCIYPTPGGNTCEDYEADEVPQAKQDCAAKNGQWSDVEACVY